MARLIEEHPGISPSKALHLLYPTITIVYFVLTLILSWCTLQGRRHHGRSNRKRLYISLGLMLMALLSYVAEGIATTLHTLTRPEGGFAPRDHIIYIMSASLVWGIILMAFVDSKSSLMYPYVGCWGIAAACETSLAVTTTSLWRKPNSFASVQVILHALRASVFALLVSTTALLACRSKQPQHLDDESQSLLGKHRDQVQYGSTTINSSQDTKQNDDSEDDSGTDAKEDPIKTHQRKRLEESGSWWTYIKAFLIFLPYIWPSQNRRLQLLFGFNVLCMLAECVLTALIPRQLGIITDALAAKHPSAPWKAVALWIVFSYLNSSAGLDLVRQLGDTLLEQFSYREVTNAAFAQVMSLSMDFHNSKDSAEVTKAVDQGRSLWELRDLIIFDVVPIGLDVIIAVGYFYYLFDAYAGLILAAVAVAYVWVGIKAVSYARPAAKKYNEKSRQEWKIMHEAVDDWETVSYFNRTEHEQKRLAAAVDESLFYDWRSTIFRRFGFGLQSLISKLGFLATSLLVVYRISIGLQPVGTFVTLTAYWAIILNPLSRVAWTHMRISRLLINAERLLQLFQTKPSVIDKDDAVPLQVTQGRVEFDNVGFSYDPRKATLEGVSFIAEGGTTVALVGKTGGGKSTIFKLLCRFYDVADGSIQIDSQDLRGVTLETLREALGVVPQDPSLFNMSIIDNVRYARLNASDEEVYEACSAAAIHDKILTFPNGYNSKVGQRGVKLSGGELQRVAIARAFLKGSKIILLDEATSAVDTETEQQIQEAFHRLSKGRTTFVIAHRLSTIVQADLILVVDDGTIIERGTHHELLRAQGKYYSMWSRQINAAHGGEAPTVFNPDMPENDSKAPEAGTALFNTGIDNRADLEQLDGPSDTAKQTLSTSSSSQNVGIKHDRSTIRGKVDAIKAKMFKTGALQYESESVAGHEGDDEGAQSSRQASMKLVSPRPTMTEPKIDDKDKHRKKRLVRRWKGKAPASGTELRSDESDHSAADISGDTATSSNVNQGQASATQSMDGNATTKPGKLRYRGQSQPSHNEEMNNAARADKSGAEDSLGTEHVPKT